jgi:phytoene dehydrogenase-like protein
MAARNGYDAIVIGAGHNGLVAAAYLAQAGMSTVVLERRGEAGGPLITGEITLDESAGGHRAGTSVRAPLLVHTVGRLWDSVVRDLRLPDHGLRSIRPAVRSFAPQPDGRSITLWTDPVRTAADLKGWSAKDAGAWAGFDRKVRSLGSFLAHLHASTPPDLRSPSVADALTGFKLARAFRGLGGHRQSREAIRVLPMAVADLVGEVFETDALRGLVAARGIQYTAMGPWAAGTAAVLLSDSAGNDGGAAGQTVFARGGPGALASALLGAARTFGAEVRCGAEVDAILTDGGRVRGVALSDGSEVAASTIVSAVDPKRTLRGLVDPVAIGPTLAWRAGNIRMPGTVAKLNLVLAGLPSFAGADAPERLAGRIVIAPGIDYLERAADAAKYGRISEEPYMEATIPSLTDPTLAPEGLHVMSVLVQFAPYHLREGDWTSERDRLEDVALKALESYAPAIRSLIVGRQVLTPVDLERDFGLTEGHPMHGEPGLDQFFAWRPLLGHARYRFGIEGLWLCGSGAHPGGGITGRPGANAAREILAHRKRART